MTADPHVLPSGVEDLLCLALHAASRAMTSRYRMLLEPFGVTYPQYLVLLVLQQQGQTSLVTIGSLLRLESSTLSPLVRRLEAMGLVSRARSTADERAVSIELTAAGVSLYEAMAEVPREISRATGFSDREQQELMSQLLRLEANLRDKSYTT